MPEELDRGSAIHLAVTAAWLAGAVAGDWLQRTHPAALPRRRVEQPSASVLAGDSGRVSDTKTPACAH